MKKIVMPLGVVAVLITLLVYFLHEPKTTSYKDRFTTEFPPRTVQRDLSKFATVQMYDEHFLHWQPESLSNSEGQLAWEISYRMSGLNEMYRATGDPKYLQSNFELARKVLSSTDLASERGSLPIWSSSKYSGGKPVAHLVHTAMITYPILDALQLGGGTLEQDEILTATLSALRVHDSQWRDGPDRGEGYFVYPPELAKSGEPLPVNRLNAMGKCLWLEWRITGSVESKRRALALARFFKNRLQLNDQGGYLWSYDLPLGDPIDEPLPEDMSHAALTVSLVPLLAEDEEVFDKTDLVRFASTLHHGVLGEENGIVYGDLQGAPDSDPKQVALPARWLEFSPYHRAIYSKLARYYEVYDRDTSPHRQSLVVALLIRFRP